MDDRHTPSGATVEHDGVCPNGHDVPSWRSTCGVCDQVMTPRSDRVATKSTDGETRTRPLGTEPTTPVVSKKAWVVLLLLTSAAIVIPVWPVSGVVFEDDFSGPTVLREWPEGPRMRYEEGAYHLSAVTDEEPTLAAVPLDTQLSGMEIELDVESVQGQPAVVVGCLSGADGPRGVDLQGVQAYSFILVPDTGEYAIVSPDGRRLAQGRVSSGTPIGHIAARCVYGREQRVTVLTMSVNEEPAVRCEDPQGFGPFDGVGFGILTDSPPAEAAFDDLRVTDI